MIYRGDVKKLVFYIPFFLLLQDYNNGDKIVMGKIIEKNRELC